MELKCKEGTYSSKPAMFDPGNCTNCPAGSFCELGAVSPTPCKAGYFGAEEKLGKKECSGRCLPGFWCPEGSISGEAVKCAAGFFGSSTGSSTSECTGRCQAGYYGGEFDQGFPFTSPFCFGPCKEGRYGDRTTVNTNENCTGLCLEGYFCPAGSPSARANLCPAGYYCPSGSWAPTPCPLGTEGRVPGLTSLSNCSLCGPGKYGDQAAATACTLCEPGKFSSEFGSRNESDCKACEPGRFSSGGFKCAACGPGTTSPEDPPPPIGVERPKYNM
jgi:hypothetical protein